MCRAPEEPIEPTPTLPPAVGLTPEAMARLGQFGALKEKIILTDEEFTAEKARILGP